jgi:site-specific DNA recombinase
MAKISEKRAIRCAIYTRKSSEEGLEQSFNSLDAQREACQAYIQSQRQEGWRALDTHYDDGGFSGGNMERPSLKRLLADIEAGKIDTVIVYKVDRLTRSLADFAKIIEKFDAHEVSFVSVTQQFNTTSSMGRLTLNVLLSFAQFEREVTGERIRDKIAASKRKGMWMGGNIPLGYDLEDRHLVVNEREAEQVREIFRLYLTFGCVKRLKADLDRRGIRSKVRVSKAGRASGGTSFSRGAVYKILSNRTYLGEIPHKGESYPGEHKAIIDKELWEKVRARMEASIRGERHGANAAFPSLLRGLVYDEEGNRFTPSHAVKRGKRYRYYTSQQVIEDADVALPSPGRIPAREIEKVVLAEIKGFLVSPDRVVDALDGADDDVASTRFLIDAARKESHLFDSKAHPTVSEWLAEVVERIVVQKESIEIRLRREALRFKILDPGRGHQRPQSHARDEALVAWTVPARFRRRSGEMRLIIPSHPQGLDTDRHTTSMLKAVARAHDWVRAILAGEYKDQRAIAAALGVNERYVSNHISAAFLAPKIVEQIVDGHEVPNLPELLNVMSLSWKEQRTKLRNAVCE